MPVIGSTTLPVAPRAHPWDGAAARRRVFDACTNGGGTVNVACVSRAFLWRAPGTDGTALGHYSLGFADWIDGRLQIVPRGIAATAGGRGVGAADIPEADADRIRMKICRVYDRVRQSHEDWPACPFGMTASIQAAASGPGWEGVIAFEGQTTGDERRIAKGALRWENLPLPLLLGHRGQVIGTVDEIERDGAKIIGRGHFSESEVAEVQAMIDRARELVTEGAVGVSVGYDDDEAESNEDGSDGLLTISDARIRHVAIEDTAAFNRAQIALVAAADESWFADPRFGYRDGQAPASPLDGEHDERLVYQEPERPEEDRQLGCPLTITDDGRIFGHVALWGRCFAGETEYLTEDGVRTLKETVGTTQRVLTSRGEVGVSRPRAAREFGGVWVDAEIRAFGVQPLMKVTLRKFGQTKEIFATPDHRWLVTPKQDKPSKHDTRKIVVTKDLEAGARLAPLFPKVKVTVGKGIRPGQFGVAHGFTFGDGSRRRDGCAVDLYGAKDEALLPYFALSTNWASENENGVRKVRVANLPAFFKDLPSRGESLSYLYGWLAGYFAADGSVSTLGTPTLYSADKGHLEYVRDVCIRLGIGTSEIKTFMRRGARTSDGRGGVINNRVSALHRITFVAQTLSAEFFLLDEHRRRFESRANENDPYTAWRVVSVESTDRIEEVYCAVVPGTENFTLLDNINVMNCHVGHAGTCLRPPKEPAAYRGFLTGARIPGVATGPIVMKTNHPSLHASAEAAQRHYHDTGLAVADVTVFPDVYGIAAAGAVREGTTQADIEALRGSALSGDWRPAGTGLRLVGLLAVNAPGYRVSRALAASGALITSGPGCTACAEERPMVDRLDSLEDELSGLKRLYAQSLIAGLD